MTALVEPFQRDIPDETYRPDRWDEVKALLVKMEALRIEADRLSGLIDNGDQSNALYESADSLENGASDVAAQFNIDLKDVRASLAAAAE